MNAFIDFGLTFQSHCPAGSYCPVGNGISETSFNNVEECPRNFPDTACKKSCNAKFNTPCNCDNEFYCIEGTSSSLKDAIPQQFTKGKQNVCYAGFNCPPASKKPQGQSECALGFYCPGYHSFYKETFPPLRCPRGNKCGERRMTKPSICPPGEYQDLSGQSRCKICSAGSFCRGGRSTPEPCAAGTFSDALGNMDASQCITCPRGSFCIEGSPLPEPCPARFYGTEGNLVSASSWWTMINRIGTQTRERTLLSLTLVSSLAGAALHACHQNRVLRAAPLVICVTPVTTDNRRGTAHRATPLELTIVSRVCFLRHALQTQRLPPS